METLNIKSLTLESKLARNGKIYLLVQQHDGLQVCWFKKDWMKIKSAMEGDIGTYPILIEQTGNETIITKTGPIKTFTLSFLIEELDELRNLTDRIDSIYNLNRIVFYYIRGNQRKNQLIALLIAILMQHNEVLTRIN